MKGHFGCPLAWAAYVGVLVSLVVDSWILSGHLHFSGPIYAPAFFTGS